MHIYVFILSPKSGETIEFYPSLPSFAHESKCELNSAMVKSLLCAPTYL